MWNKKKTKAQQRTKLIALFVLTNESSRGLS